MTIWWQSDDDLWAWKCFVLNYANEKGAGFDSNTNHIYVYNKNGKECEFKKDTKERIAKKLVNHIINE